MSSLLSASLKGTGYLIGLQLISRLLTFSLNTLILRYTSPSVFGFATIQLELLLNTILFLCREGFRLAVQRLPRSDDENATRKAQDEIANLSTVPVILGAFLGSASTGLFILYAPAESSSIPYFTRTVLLYGLATILELASEPAYNIALHGLAFKRRAACEGIAVLARCIVTFVAAMTAQTRTQNALPFAYGQVAYGLTLFVAYYIATRASLLPRLNAQGLWVSASALRFALLSTAQGVLKHFLTEGDKILISWLSSNAEQGTYGLAANYGGLVARIILQPVEEASRSFFTQATGDPKAADEKAYTVQVKANKDALTMLLSIYSIVSLMIVAIVPAFLKQSVPLLLGNSSRWASITPVLVAFVYYLPFLAANGVLEAFLTATATPSDLKQQSLAWFGFSAAYGIAGYTLQSFGAVGLVAANAVNLALRIIYSWLYAQRYFQSQQISLSVEAVAPTAITTSVCILVTGLSSRISLQQSSGVAALAFYMAKVAFMGMMMLSVVALAERKRLLGLFNSLKASSYES
jgi:oligosaccharide translocation protein RFT1